MTVIVGLAHEHGAVLAADSMTTDDFHVWHNPSKLFTLPAGRKDSVVIGVAGCTGLGAVIRHELKIDAAPDGDDPSDIAAWAHATAGAISEAGVEAGFRVTKGNTEGQLDGDVLMAWRGHLWEISHRLALPVAPFGAVGAGRAVAVGALEILTQVGEEPQRAVVRAVEAACRHNAICRGPVQVVTTSEGGDHAG